MSEESDPEQEPNAEDVTLGGYLTLHKRPPAFEGSDGLPYTVSIEVEQTGDLRTPVLGYLVFPRWAATGVGIVGHVETPVLWEGQTKREVEAAVKSAPLLEVKRLLDEAIGMDAEDREGE
jgi:hypothetical protein